jgi:uncharacterized protein YegL
MSTNDEFLNKENPTDVPGFGDDKPQTPRTACQLGILVLDGSGSMTEPDKSGIAKHAAVNAAIKDTVSRLHVSSRVTDIDLSLIRFGGPNGNRAAEVFYNTAPVLDYDPMSDYDPLLGGNTYIAAGLEKALEVANSYISSPPVEGVPTDVLILVMTDGMFSENPQQIVNEIKKNNQIKMCACFFGKEADQSAVKALKDIVTDQVSGYLTVYNTEQLKKFFLASIQALGVK